MLKPDTLNMGASLPGKLAASGTSGASSRTVIAGVGGTSGISEISNPSDVSPPTIPLHDHDWITRHIPHAGAMCLLDAVIECDDAHIVCSASSHRRADHPLRSRGRLSAVVAIEYAAQAMAAHGAALAQRDAPPAAGFLTAVRSVHYGVDRLDTLPDNLRCEATRLSGDARNILYAFEVRAGAQTVANGRATVMLEASAPQGETPSATRS
jgi:predicted hotdog family 3-hydroxylacyl-ACP dehydratase